MNSSLEVDFMSRAKRGGRGNAHSLLHYESSLKSAKAYIKRDQRTTTTYHMSTQCAQELRRGKDTRQTRKLIIRTDRIHSCTNVAKGNSTE